MKLYLLWIILTVFALTALAVDTYICKWSGDDYECKLIKDDSDEEPSDSIKDWKDI